MMVYDCWRIQSVKRSQSGHTVRRYSSCVGGRETDIIFQSFSIHLDTSQKPGGGVSPMVGTWTGEKRDIFNMLLLLPPICWVTIWYQYQLSNIARIKRAAGTSAISCMKQSTGWCQINSQFTPTQSRSHFN